VELFEQEPEEGDAPFHVLHVERVEIHDEASLDRRNQEFAALAAEKGVEDYDGMDVGPAPARSNARTGSAGRWPAMLVALDQRRCRPAAGTAASAQLRARLAQLHWAFGAQLRANSATPGGSSTITVEP
jgi:hypothetical protein